MWPKLVCVDMYSSMVKVVDVPGPSINFHTTTGPHFGLRPSFPRMLFLLSTTERWNLYIIIFRSKSNFKELKILCRHMQSGVRRWQSQDVFYLTLIKSKPPSVTRLDWIYGRETHLLVQSVFPSTSPSWRCFGPNTWWNVWEGYFMCVVDLKIFIEQVLVYDSARLY